MKSTAAKIRLNILGNIILTSPCNFLWSAINFSATISRYVYMTHFNVKLVCSVCKSVIAMFTLNTPAHLPNRKSPSSSPFVDAPALGPPGTVLTVGAAVEEVVPPLGVVMLKPVVVTLTPFVVTSLTVCVEEDGVLVGSVITAVVMGSLAVVSAVAETVDDGVLDVDGYVDGDADEDDVVVANTVVVGCVVVGKPVVVIKDNAKKQNNGDSSMANTQGEIIKWYERSLISPYHYNSKTADSSTPQLNKSSLDHKSLTHWGRVTHLCARWAPRHYLNQCKHIVN